MMAENRRDCADLAAGKSGNKERKKGTERPAALRSLAAVI
jgi:hypothetical protein